MQEEDGRRPEIDLENMPLAKPRKGAEQFQDVSKVSANRVGNILGTVEIYNVQEVYFKKRCSTPRKHL